MSTAVFLSYAREDQAAARRIAEALRGFGVEVWFDENELRGGDAWDQKIRRQIKECTLFVPVISANTQQRGEGYFRLEWKLATERTHLMAEGLPFIAPVVVDDTPDGAGGVPAEFARVQWTRLPGGLPSPQFIEQIKRLLAGPRTAAPWSPAPGPAASRAPALSARKSGLPGWAWATTAAVVLLAAGVWFWSARSSSNNQQPITNNPAAAPSAPAKSIAVLPFDNLSTDKDLEFFADGMHDEVISSLTKIRDLKVISRSSVMAYRDRTKRNMRAIGAELGVATIIEGSVQRSGNQVKVIVQLIDAKNEGHLWNGQYVKELTKTFEIQSELSEAITSSLRATISPEEKSLIARRPTENQEAYDLYLQGRALHETIIAQGETREGVDRVAALYDQAVAKDPAFTLAWAQLTYIHGFQYWFGDRDPTPARRARIKAALEATQRASAEAPETRMATGLYYYTSENNWARDLTEYRAAESGMPNDAQLKNLIGIAQRRLGQWDESLASISRAIALNPRSANYPIQQAYTLSELRRYPEIRELLMQSERLFPRNPSLLFHKTYAQFELNGDRAAWLRQRGENPPEPNDPFGLDTAYELALSRADYGAADQALSDRRLTSIIGPGNTANEPVALHRGYVAFLRGDRTAARVYADEAIASYRAGQWVPRQEPWVKAGIAIAHALAGRADEAVKLAKEAYADQVGRDAYDAVLQRHYVALVYLLLDLREDALRELRELMANPSYLGPQQIRASPFWDPVRNDPRFEQYLKLAKRL